VEKVAKRVREEREQELDATVASAKRALEKAQQQLRMCKQAVKRHLEDAPSFREMNSALDELQAVRPERALQPLSPGWEFAGRVTDPLDEICAEMKEQCRDAVAGWQRHEEKARAKLPASVTVTVETSYRAGNAIIEWLSRALDNEFYDTRDLIEQKLRARYILRWKHYQAEVTAQIHAIHRAVLEELRGRLARLARNQVKLLRAQLDEYEASVNRQTKALKAKKSDAERVVDQHIGAVRHEESRRQEILDALRVAERSADKFRGRLRQEFEKARSEVIRETAAAGDPLRALAAAIAVLDHAQAYDRITGG
jgi:hypothetical protein